MRTPPSRRWHGVAADDRRASRRQRILDAGTELLGTTGGKSVTVRALCRTAGVTERYFYESFSSRDELVAAVFAEMANEVMSHMSEVVTAAPTNVADRARVFIAGAIDFFSEDPRRGRVLVREAMTEQALTQQGLHAAPTLLGTLLEDVIGPTQDPDSQLLTGAVLGLGIGALIVAWLDGQVDVTRDTLVEHCAQLIERAVVTRS
ncbi:MAG: TetR/AcrR family transcriptional regulator [Rhodococcus sp. (in: high G+C Gram-positive bacteria)]|uniref:TetR/AcrR family transcriptional regulator n=1 Tax=Rhodococcus sp. TaxID=1831 RepID=UPI003BAF26E6